LHEESISSLVWVFSIIWEWVVWAVPPPANAPNPDYRMAGPGKAEDFFIEYSS